MSHWAGQMPLKYTMQTTLRFYQVHHSTTNRKLESDATKIPLRPYQMTTQIPLRVTTQIYSYAIEKSHSDARKCHSVTTYRNQIILRGHSNPIQVLLGDHSNVTQKYSYKIIE